MTEPRDSEQAEGASADALVRFGLSMPSSLALKLDSLVRRKGYSNRSEAVRDLVRDALVHEEWEEDAESAREMVGVVTLVYQHTLREVSENLIETQHAHHHVAHAALHVHLSHEHCLEVIVLRGARDEVRAMADQLTTARGVLHGQFVPTTSGENF